MAYSFNGTSDTLIGTPAAATTYPLTFSAWVNVTDTATNKTVIGLGQNSNSNFAILYLPSSEVVSLYFRLNTATDRVINGSAGPTPGTWQHICGTIDSSRVPRVYLDGSIVGTGTDGGAGNFGGLTQTTVGVRDVVTDDFFYSGSIAEAAIWTRQISDAEITALSKGYSPLFFRNSLTFYRDLIRDLNRPYIGGALTAAGTTVAAHPPKIIYPPKPRVAPVSSAASSVTVGSLVDGGLLRYLVGGGLVR